jgi:hypothetical protein
MTRWTYSDNDYMNIAQDQYICLIWSSLHTYVYSIMYVLYAFLALSVPHDCVEHRWFMHNFKCNTYLGQSVHALSGCNVVSNVNSATMNILRMPLTSLSCLLPHYLLESVHNYMCTLSSFRCVYILYVLWRINVRLLLMCHYLSYFT